MTSDLSIFAARLRDFISICADETAFGVPSRHGADGPTVEPALHAHYDAEFNGMALVLFALQFNRNPAYRKFCEARKTFPDAITHRSQIPAVPTTAFKELDLTCLPKAERTAVFHSSGTTGQTVSRHFHNVESLALYEASLRPWFSAHVLPGLSPDTRHLTLLSPSPTQAPHSSLAHMFATVWSSAFRRSEAHRPPEGGTPNDIFAADVSSDGAWVLNSERALRALNRSMEESRNPLVLLGTAFSFVQLLDDLAGQNLSFKLPPGSRVMETGGYKGRSRVLPRAELHSLITERLGIPPTHIVCEYGMSELSSQAYDLAIQNSKFKIQKCDRVFHFPPWARVQIISPETGREVAEGETGLLRVFDLANVFSVMAIQTEDLAVRRGTGFQLIGRAELSEPRGCSLMAAGS